MSIWRILFTCIVFLYIFLVTTFFLSCKNYNGNFHYSSHVVSFHLNELITAQNDTPIFFVRFFINKVSITILDIFYRYIQYFNVFYVANIAGIIGLVGLLYFFTELIAEESSKYKKILAVSLFLLPFVEIFQLIKQPFLLKIIFLVVPYQIASFIGISFYLKQKNASGNAIFLLLLCVSIGWAIIFNTELTSFCTVSY